MIRTVWLTGLSDSKETTLVTFDLQCFVRESVGVWVRVGLNVVTRTYDSIQGLRSLRNTMINPRLPCATWKKGKKKGRKKWKKEERGEERKKETQRKRMKENWEELDQECPFFVACPLFYWHPIYSKEHTDVSYLNYSSNEQKIHPIALVTYPDEPSGSSVMDHCFSLSKPWFSCFRLKSMMCTWEDCCAGQRHTWKCPVNHDGYSVMPDDRVTCSLKKKKIRKNKESLEKFTAKRNLLWHDVKCDT